MKTVAQQIFELGIVPVVKLDNAQDAVPLAKALVAGGLRCIELTFRTDAAEEAIRLVSKEVPEMLVGAGTVLNCEQIDRAIDAGAKFIVSPGFNEVTAKYCIEKNVPIIPGCNNPSSIEKALELGLTNLKFFPAEQSGGLSMIKALCAPYTTIHFMPTGGVNENNLNEYLAFDKIIACGGTWMVKDSLIKEKRFDEVERISREAVHKMLGFELCHVGINCANAAESAKEAKKLSALLGLPLSEKSASCFSGKEFEFMSGSGRGTNGHLAIACNSVDRAYAYLSAQGYEFLEDTAKREPSGSLSFIYLKEEIGGFAIHLIRK
ncbi:MAG: bifunctional 4-hydroxy-2-oxoglutarate aldolase/2-dehydro-3-deoxy-phosphogluconate aldolase [Oscillospiraceae bacterium]